MLLFLILQLLILTQYCLSFKEFLQQNWDYLNPIQNELLHGQSIQIQLHNRHQYQSSLTKLRTQTLKQRQRNEVGGVGGRNPIRIGVLSMEIYNSLQLQDSEWTNGCMVECEIMPPVDKMEEWVEGEGKIYPQVVLSPWINNEFWSLIKQTPRLKRNHTSPYFALNQILAVLDLPPSFFTFQTPTHPLQNGDLNGSGKDAQLLAEYLSHLDLYIGLDLNADIRVKYTIPPTTTRSQSLKELKGEIIWDWLILPVILSNERIISQCTDENRWYAKYLQKLNHLSTIYSYDSLCFPTFRHPEMPSFPPTTSTTPTTTQTTTTNHLEEIQRFAFVFYFEQSLIPYRMSPHLLSYQHMPSLLIFYFGLGNALYPYLDSELCQPFARGLQPPQEQWIRLKFPVKRHQQQTHSRESHVIIEIPRCRIISIFHFQSVEMLVDFKDYLQHTPEVYLWLLGLGPRLPPDSQEVHRHEKEVQQAIQLTSKHENNLFCQICQYYRTTHDYYAEE